MRQTLLPIIALWLSSCDLSLKPKTIWEHTIQTPKNVVTLPLNADLPMNVDLILMPPEGFSSWADASEVCENIEVHLQFLDSGRVTAKYNLEGILSVQRPNGKLDFGMRLFNSPEHVHDMTMEIIDPKKVLKYPLKLRFLREL